MPQLPQGLSSYVVSSYRRSVAEDFALGSDYTKIAGRAQASILLSYGGAGLDGRSEVVGEAPEGWDGCAGR